MRDNDSPANSQWPRESGRLIRHALVNWSGLAASGATGLVLVPVMLHHLGRSSYGLWIGMESAAAMLARVDLGVPWAVMRESALSSVEDRGPTTHDFFSAAAGVTVLVGLGGWLVMAALGGPIGLVLGIAPRSSLVLFTVGGAIFFFETFKNFTLSILRGVRRFDLVNVVVAGAALLWTAGAIALLASGARLLVLVGWQALSASIGAAFSLCLVSGRAWNPRFRLMWPRLRVLKDHVRFGLTSQIVAAVNAAMWDAPLLVIGMVLGSASMVPYYVGRMFPSAASAVPWRSAEVMFPAASQSESDPGRLAGASVLDSGSRLSIVAMAPICIVLWVYAPNLLKVWVGDVSTEAVTILRILVLVEMLDAVALGSATYLWGTAALGPVLAVNVAMMATAIVFSVPLVMLVGVPGAAFALLLAVGVGSAAYIVIASRRCAVVPTKLMRAVFHGLGLAMAACFIAAAVTNYLVPAGSPIGVVVVPGTSTVAYIAALRLRGARPEEAEALSFIGNLAMRFARSLVS